MRKNLLIQLIQDFYYPFRLSPKAICITQISTLMLFLGIAYAAAAPIHAQSASVTLRVKNTTIENVLEKIEEETEFRFFYNSTLIDANRKINVDMKDADIFKVLDHVFKNTNVDYKVIDNDILLVTKDVDSVTQTTVPFIKGSVLDTYGDPVIGANVLIKGSGDGVISDINGDFSIAAPIGSILVISYIGYIPMEITVKDDQKLNIVMQEDSQALDEVVVVGYGVQKRASVTGSVASIQSKDITTVKTPSVTNALAGKLPGLRAVQRSGAPGDDAASLDIRGFGSALVIVDGIERDFSQIDANDIESISILKDASASVYGFKGANGVILITTKKGEISKPKISYSGYYGLQSITRYPEMLNGYEYATLYNEAQQNVGVAPPYSADDLERFKNGIGTTNWYDETIRNAIPQTYHNLSVSGGSTSVKYYFSLGYTYQEGIYKSNDYDFSKYNVRSNISAEIAKGFTVDLQLSGRLDTRNKPYEDEPLTRSIQMAKPVFPIYANDNPEYWSNPGDKGNPVHLSRIDNVGYDRRDRREFTGAISFNWQIPWVEGLTAKALMSYDYNNLYSRKWYKEYYEYAYDPVNEEYNVQSSHNLSELTTKSENYFKPNVQLSLNYQKTFGAHDFGVLGLWEFYNDRKDWVEAYRQFSISAIDQINAGDKTNMNNGGSAAVSSHAGLVGRLNYAYAGKYLAEVSFRYDGSYKFDPSQRWGFFPSASLGWRISEETFFKNALPFVDNLKIRGSIGKVGDETTYKIGDKEYMLPYQYLTGYKYPDGSYVLGADGLTNGAVDRGMANPNLTWYKATTTNVGFEASIYNGLFSMEFDYFNRNREGLLATRLLTLPTTFGQSLPDENLNSDKTRGFEIVVGHRNTIHDFTYDVRANFSTTREYNDYVERAASANMYDDWRNNSNSRYKNIQWGKKVVGQFQSYEEIFNSPIQDGNGNKSLMPGDLKFQDWNNDGIIDDKDDQPIGHGDTPRMYYGLNLSASYKGFDLTVFFQGAAGHEVFTGGDFLDPFIQQGLGNGISLWMDRWHLADPSDPSSEWIPGYMPALRPTGYQANRSDNTWTMQNARYLRLKTLELGYSLPKNILDHVGIDNLRVYVNAFNLLTFTGREGLMKYMDPENNSGSFRYYPQMKTFNFGVNLTF
ncbi:MAG: TonB-dependent receptor [Tannerellaceae bacterium]|nr:TonB-dependent receptor [Tannerellaceae bacterium]